MIRHQGKQPNPEYTIVLFYQYTQIVEPQATADAQRALCEQFDLKGRIIIAHEGINATLEGRRADVEAYCAGLISGEGGGRWGDFSNTHFKKSVGIGTAFPKLSVKVRKEIVSSHLDDLENRQDLENCEESEKSVGRSIDPARRTGKRLKPEELRAWFEERQKNPDHTDSKREHHGEHKRDFVIIDMRNDFEHAVGHFRDSILPEMHNFRDLPKAIEKIEKQDASLKEKTVLTVCTGGVRCEKASAYLLERGFKDVYQLDGGIVSYMEKYPSRDFDGALYVFDGRVTMHFDDHTVDNNAAAHHIASRRVIGKCALCGASSERYADCSDERCHFHFIACANCADEQGRAFCPDCQRNSLKIAIL